MQARVALVHCPSYDRIQEALQRGLDLLGGADQFGSSAEKLLFKPNVLVGDSPASCVVTHTALFEACVKLFSAAGAQLFYGDSPGLGTVKSQLKKSGYTAVASRCGVALADFMHGREVVVGTPKGEISLSLAKGALDASGIISLSKMKTHQFMRITGAIKNQFGCVPGLSKPGYHVRFPHPDDFALMLCLINQALPMRLYIMDGIMAMEGNGPRGGDPVKMNVLLLSADPVALDATFCRLIDLDPQLVPVIRQGYRVGLGTWREEEIEMVGDPLATLINRNFKVNRQGAEYGLHEKGLLLTIKNILAPRPVINKSACIRCGICVDVCPVVPKALTWRKNKKGRHPPVYNYSDCIRCYCCQEMCPEKAIKRRKSLPGKILFRR